MLLHLAFFQPKPQAADDLSWREVQSILHAELQRLPEKYRLPLILCCLEGRTRDEAARQLGWTFGTLKGMLDRGRDLLRKRLERRGVTLGAVLATITLTQDAVAAGIAMTTARAALAFAAGQATSLASATSYASSVLISQMAMPSAICQAVYNNVSGYSQSITNFAAISTSTDNVFSDNTAAQLAQQTPSLAGSTSAGYSGTILIGVGA